MKNKKKAMIFDLDGVIVDTAKFHFLAWQNMAKSLGIEFDHVQNEQLKGVSRVDSLNKILHWGKVSVSEEKFSALMRSKNEDYLAHVDQMNEGDLLPGVAETLAYLKENKVPMALGSASKNARRILKKLNITADFDAIVDGTDVSKAKPDPEVFLVGAKKLEIDANQCVVFEDSIAGIKAANNAGMTSIGIGEASVLKDADYTFHDFTEIDQNFLIKLLTLT